MLRFHVFASFKPTTKTAKNQNAIYLTIKPKNIKLITQKQIKEKNTSDKSNRKTTNIRHQLSINPSIQGSIKVSNLNCLLFDFFF